MRDFKFRGWDKKTNKMIDVKTIEYDNNGLNEFTGKNYLTEIEYRTLKNDEKYYQHRTRSEFNLMQYTGIHDDSEDEKEIYEGDNIIFTYNDIEYIAEVKFEAGTFILCNEYLPNSYITFIDIVQSDRDYWWIDGKVVGNIYEG